VQDFAVEDMATLTQAVYDEIEAEGGVTASNMRGTDSALLAASYTAPDNTTIGNTYTEVLATKTAAQNAETDADLAKTAAQSADGKLPSDTTTKINRLDTTISSRSSHDAAAVYTYIQSQGGVTSSNMRGTDSALLAASYTAPDNTGIAAAETAARLSR